jgi:hypothetical protein
VLPRVDVHHRTKLTNPKQVARVARNIGRFTNYHKSFQVFVSQQQLSPPSLTQVFLKPNMHDYV